MAASIHQTARNLFAWGCGNAKNTAAIRTAFDAAVSGGALSRGGMDSVTSANKNGVMVQKMVGLSEGDRQTALRWALEWIEAGYAPSSRSVARF